eukprot:COSAG02_NODE_22336_length_756_cov_0.668189_2_plen_92_part_00
MIVTQICFSLLFSLAFRATGVITFPIERRHLRGCVVLATVWCVWLSALRPVPGLAGFQRCVQFLGSLTLTTELREYIFSARYEVAHAKLCG